jgi:hypothetical protein
MPEFVKSTVSITVYVRLLDIGWVFDSKPLIYLDASLLWYGE